MIRLSLGTRLLHVRLLSFVIGCDHLFDGQSQASEIAIPEVSAFDSLNDPPQEKYQISFILAVVAASHCICQITPAVCVIDRSKEDIDRFS
ncbi:hypothetical protein NPIL_69251 [Nephila pilipes]|uniref:Secreted protein n=1 Tax=Nephila pilipes TaxID=299642 RepID=A0A8X6UGK6_NEPPI|nr:hypothetical protein NPIL_69251 [Nephila pilipes]